MHQFFRPTYSRLLTVLLCLITLAAIRIIEPAGAIIALQENIFQSSFENLVANKAPIANAGSDQVIYGDGVYPALLIGERSEDVDSTNLTALWEDITVAVIPGDPPVFNFPPTVTFGAATGLNQEYFASPLNDTGFLTFRLTVSDSDGASSSDEVNVTVLSSIITATVNMQGVIPPGAQPELFLYDPDGNLLTSGSGDGVIIDHRLGAGVAYAVATANEPVDMTLSVTLPDGTVLNSELILTELAPRSQQFITTTDTNLGDNLPNLLVMGYRPDSEGLQNLRFDQHPQIIEIALPHPDPGLRDPNRFLSFLNQTSIRYQEDAASAEAYYRAVDPNNERTTLEDWLDVTGFTVGGDGASAIYQNDADLGFGREMHMRESNDGTISGYVRNFPSLDHAIANEKLIATVTMEFGVNAGHPEPYTKFFAYGPDGKRLLAADLDGRGAKAIPGACNVCHGGSPKATFRDGLGIVTYPDQGDTNAQFLPWDLDTFNFSNEPGLLQTDQEQAFFELNQLTKATFPSDPASVIGVHWSGAASTELINGWYDGVEVFDGAFVPPAWRAQQAHIDLYLEVVAPNCRACHVTRGTAEQNVIDFSSYEKFFAYAPMIQELVFNQGVMPLASRTFGHFWEGASNSAATKLAIWLESISPSRYALIQASGDALKPGRPQSRTGMFIDGPEHLAIVQKSPKGTLLDGRNSLFASNQNRRVVTLVPIVGEDTVEFGQQAISKPGVGDLGNLLRIARQIVAPAEVKRVLFGRVEESEFFKPNFISIQSLLVSQCTGCHRASTPNIPVSFDDADPVTVYREVLDRINFEQPSQSMILTKPGGLRHGFNGDPSLLFDSAVTDWGYFDGVDGDIKSFDTMGSSTQLVVQWIQSGAPFITNDSQNPFCMNVGLPIPDNDANGITDVIYFGPAQIGSGLQVDMLLDHASLSDLEINLTHLDTGKISTLVNRPTGQNGLSCERQNINLTFLDGAQVPSSTDLCKVDPFELVLVQPNTPLNVFDQIPMSGSWQLTVKDLSAGGTGTLNQWCLRNQK